ncbi:MAG: HAD hydrolase-like protein [Mycobacteriales bacterium]
MLVGCEQPLAAAYDVALLDLDGVVYVGGSAVPGAADALVAARRLGMRTAFVTNNALRTPGTIASHLRELGIEAVDADVVTSAQAAARLLRDGLSAGASVFVAGGEGLRQEVLQAGLTLARSAEDHPAAVVQGYTPDADYAMLAEATLAIRAGAWWVAANRDATMPSPRGRVPGNGALVALVAAATDQEPVVAGKPESALHRESIERTAAARPLVVGDRLDTDILGAVRSGADSLLVFTGVTDPVDLLGAESERRPSYLAAGLDGLLSPHSGVDVRVEGGWATARCARWSAAASAHELRLSRTDDGPPNDKPEPHVDPESDKYAALGALCAAAWRLAGEAGWYGETIFGASAEADAVLQSLDLALRSSR